MEKKAELLMAFISRPSKALFVDWISVQVYLFVIHTNHSFASLHYLQIQSPVLTTITNLLRRCIVRVKL